MDKILKTAFNLALKLKWDTKPAKPDGRMNLLTHSLNAMAIADRLITAYEQFNIYKFSDKERRIVLSALFIHDFSKSDEDISEQISMRKINEIPKRLKNREEVIKCLEKLGTYSEVDVVIDHAISMEYASISDLEEFLSSKPVNRKLDRILKLSDRLAGINLVDGALEKSIVELTKPLELKIHRVSVVRGISTQLLHKAVQRIFERCGWYPLLSTPDGTVYIGKGEIGFSEDELLSELLSEFRELIDSFGDDDIGNAAFGSFTSTAIKIPEFVFLSEKSAESFWNFIGSKNAISNPKDLSKNDRKTLEALKTTKPDSFEEYDYLFKLYNSMRYLLMMGVAVLKEAKNISKRLYENLKNNLEERGVDVESLMEANPRYNSPFSDVIPAVDEFIEKLGLADEKRETIVDKTIKIFRESTSKAVKETDFDQDTLRRHLKDLMSDLGHPKLNKSNWSDSYQSYLDGKIRGTPVCPLCGDRGEEAGIASLIGKGTESFGNLLSGGSTIGGENKPRICTTCIFEAKLRALVGDVEKSELFFVIPQTSIAPNLTEIFWSVAKEKLSISNYQSSAIPSIDDLTKWGRLILSGRDNEIISKSVSEIIRESVELASKNKRIRKAIENKIKENYGDFESFAEDFRELMGYEVKSIEGLLNLIFEGRDEIIEYLELEEVMKRRKIEVIPSSNYVVLLFDRIGKRDDTETVNLLRKIFVALIISKMFSSSVVISDIPISVLASITPKGAVKTPLKLGIREFIEPYTKDGWIAFEKYHILLRKLSALLILENKLLGIGSGSSTLYELTKMSPGRILHKIVEGMGGKIRKEHLKEILKLLKEVEG